MNRKIVCFVILFVMLSYSVFAQDSPMNGWSFSQGVTLNGRYFMADMGYARSYPDSYREQDGYALVLGVKFHYWLYDTISYHDGNSSDIYNLIIPKWVEDMGYVIDYDNIQISDPNPDLATSVRTLMSQRGCDVSVALVTAFNPHYVVINEYFKTKGSYKTTVYYLYK